MQEKIRTKESEDNRTKSGRKVEGRSFAYLFMFIKLIFRQSNIVCVGTSSLLTVKMNNLAVCCY